MKKLSIIVIALAMLIALTGVATATVLPNATKETGVISTVTSVQCDGIVLGAEEYSAQVSNQALDGAPLQKGEIYGASVYTNKLMAVNGKTSYVKTVDTNTKNSIVGQSNVKTDEQVVFVANDGGRATAEEAVTLFNAGQATDGVGTSTLCPFTNVKGTTNPPFNTMVTQFSKIDVSQVSLATQMAATTIAGTADVPLTVDYNVNAEGVGDITAGTSIFAQDARGDGTTVAATTPVSTGGYNYVPVGDIKFVQNQYLNQNIGKTSYTNLINQNGANVAGSANGGNAVANSNTVAGDGGNGGKADADALAIAIANAEATNTDKNNNGDNGNHGNKNYCPTPDPSTNVNADADAAAIAAAIAIGGNGGNGGDANSITTANGGNGGVIDQTNVNNVNINQVSNNMNSGVNTAIQNIYLPKTWVVGNDGKIYAPVPAPVVKPSAEVAYKDTTTASGVWKFTKTMSYKSGVGIAA